MNACSDSPPAGRLTGNCEAPVAGLSYRRRVREAVTVLRNRYGLARTGIAALLVAILLGASVHQLGSGAYIVLKAELAQLLIARAWQANLSGGIATERPWPWADMRPIARLELIEQRESLYVLDNDSGRSLAFGPGLRVSSTAPGRGGNTVISGHRDTHFSALRHIEVGDRIQLQTVRGRLIDYRVTRLRIIDQSENWVAAEHGIDELTLITCWPFDALTPRGPERLVVSAERSNTVTRHQPSP